MWTGKTALRAGLKSTDSLKVCCFANRFNGFSSYIVVVLMSLTFISVLLSLFVFMTNGPGQSGHLVGKFEVLSSKQMFW